MSENLIEQIVSELKQTGQALYPDQIELRNVRVVGHTPRNDHYIYDIVIDFSHGSERLAAKVYRSAKSGPQGASKLAEMEAGNVRYAYEIFKKKKLSGVPRPLGDFSHIGAVVTEKLSGLPLQSIIMKAALLPGYANHESLSHAARQAGGWLRGFHRATADMQSPLDGPALLAELEAVCESCRGEGLDNEAIKVILSGARGILARTKKSAPNSAVLNDFTPLNVMVCEQGMGFSDFARMAVRGNSLQDVAIFLAAVEALEKYPFCNRAITVQLQDEFVEAYGLNQQEKALVRVLKMKALLGMFAQGRNGKESAIRKKIMWATVMKRFIQQAAQRSMAPAA